LYRYAAIQGSARQGYVLNFSSYISRKKVETKCAKQKSERGSIPLESPKLIDTTPTKDDKGKPHRGGGRLGAGKLQRGTKMRVQLFKSKKTDCEINVKRTEPGKRIKR